MTNPLKNEDPGLLEKIPGGELTEEDLRNLDAKKSGFYAFEQADETKRAWMAGLLQGEANFGVDKRKRSKSQSPGYVPAPPIPVIKLAMVEKDLLEHYGELVEQNVVTENRKTSTGKSVYKVTLCQRDKVERLLNAILPHVVGEKTRSRILALLSICKEYHESVANGGRSNAASLAATIGHQKRKQKRQQKKI